MKKLNRAVIKEELVALTGDFKKAIVLNQMIYWSERREDTEKFLQEEMERAQNFNESEEKISFIVDTLESNGWIYKKAEELSEETMIGVKPKAMREYLKYLVENDWIQQRRNPKVGFDRTLQYRVNLLKIQYDLMNLGYSLEGYSLPIGEKENTYFPKENTKEQKENTMDEKENTKGKKENTKGLKGRNNTRDYSETTSRDYSSEELLRENILYSVLGNFEDIFSTDDMIKIKLALKNVKMKKHLVIKQVLEMDAYLKTGQPIYSKPSYFITGYEAKLEADSKKVKKELPKTEEEYRPTVPFYNWLDQ